jgi:hypothetical protein
LQETKREASSTVMSRMWVMFCTSRSFICPALSDLASAMS